MDSSPFMTTEELAELTRSSPATVRYWRHMGTGPAGVKVGRRTLYDRADVAAWLEAKKAPREANQC